MIPEDQRTCITTPDCPTACGTTVPETDQHAPYCPHHTPGYGTAWCPTCGRTRTVTDRFTAGHHTRYGEVEYGVTALTCGHNLQSPEKVIAPAPGAPYAGGIVAASTRTRDLRAADEAQRVADSRDVTP